MCMGGNAKSWKGNVAVAELLSLPCPQSGGDLLEEGSVWQQPSRSPEKVAHVV